MNEPPKEATIRELMEVIGHLASVVESQGQAIVFLNDSLGKVARHSGMKVENVRDKLNS